MRNFLLCVAIGASILAVPARADQFGDIGFRVPEGWQKVEKGGLAILAGPLDERGKPRVAIFVTPGSGYEGDFGRWFEATVRQGESGETSIVRSAVQRIAAKGDYEALAIDSTTRDAQGTTTRRTYVATNPGGRAELFVYITYSEQAARRYLPKLREFLASVSYAQAGIGATQATGATRPVAPAPAHRPAAGRCRTVTTQQCMSGISGGFGGTMTPTYNCLPVSKTVCD